MPDRGTTVDDALSIAQQGRVLRPRMKALIGGYDPKTPTVPPDPTIVALYPKAVMVQKSNKLGADRFKAVFALGDGQDYQFWAESTGLSFNLELRYEPDPFVLVFSGIADNVDCDVFRGEVTLTGRNYAAVLHNEQAKIGTYNNKSKKEIVDSIAGPYGITVDYGDTEPEGNFGVKVNDDYAHQALGSQSVDISKWDILARIAMQTGRTCYITNRVLHFHDTTKFATFNCIAPTRTYDKDGKVAHLGFSNATALRFTHDLTMIRTKASKVTHIDYHGPEASVQKNPPDASPEELDRAVHVQVVNRDVADVEKFAASYSRIIQIWEWYMEWTTTGPEMLPMEVTDIIQVSGTHSGFDGPYQIQSIEHNINWERGLLTTVIGRWGDGSSAPKESN